MIDGAAAINASPYDGVGMSDPIEKLVARLGLEPHPEGGLFREIFRSSRRVGEGAEERAAVTSIWFLIPASGRSRWHRVAQDEVWHFCGGRPLDLLLLAPDLERTETRVLSPLGAPGEPIAVVPAHHWQAARPRGGWTLASCTVAPGFEYSDFALLADHSDLSARLRERHPELAELL